jgi:uncharacterized protein YcsI (UPF0317 family)
MSRFRFEKLQQIDSSRLTHDTTSVIYECDGVVLQDILEDFANFLKGCGFSFDGELVIEKLDDH